MAEESKKINKKQRIFIDAYLATMSYEKAAKEAGYKCPLTTGYNLGHTPHIQADIARLMAFKMEELGYTKNHVIQELCRVAFADITEFVEWRSEFDEETQRYRHRVIVYDSATIDGHVIKGIKVSQQGKVEIDLYDKMAALDKIAKLLNIFPSDKIEVTGKDGGAIQIESLRNKLIDRISKIAVTVENDNKEEE